MLTQEDAVTRRRHLTTAGKLGGAFATIILLTALLGGAAVFALHQVNADAQRLSDRWLPALGHFASARAFMLETRDFEIRHTKAEDESYMDEYEEKAKAALTSAQQSLDALDDMAAAQAMGPEGQALVAPLTKAWNSYRDVHAKVLQLGRAGQTDDARDISEGAGKSNLDDAILALDKASRYAFEQAQEAGRHADQLYQRAVLGVIVVFGITLAAGVGLAVALSRNLLKQLGGEPTMVSQLLRSIAQGDLTQPVPVRAGDQNSVMACMHDMQQGLSMVVKTVREGSESVATASAEIASGNNDLSTRTEQQASALQQTAASMEQLGSTVTQNAESAHQANDLAQEASGVAQRGGAAVSEVVEVMKGINDSSRRIADITSVIDGIAFQTNILALNAAVEAARAGEQGRGFAVVAAEVRSLAQRSATAAKEIKTLISASVEQIQLGSQQVDRAGDTMQEVVQAIQRVSQIVHEISVASQEQSQGVHQVGEAIAQMDHGTQQNAALVEQSAAAAESLRHQSNALVQAVAVFRLNDSGRH
jgi:methyl-accepting chemotaxis protein